MPPLDEQKHEKIQESHGDTKNELNDTRCEELDIEGMDEGSLNSSMSSNVLLEKADRSLSELNRWYNSGRIILDPEWQRNFVWDNGRASRLIESFLLDIPVPVIYLAKNDDGIYEVIDGLQRLTSVFRFFANKFKLQTLDIRNDLRGKSFRELPQKDQQKFEDAILRSFELSSGQGDIHFIVFERLNTGGVKLNDMEIRNCLYRGSLNSLIKELAGHQDFKRCLAQKGIEKRMQDRGLVLRFLAFYERTHHKCQQGLKKFLNEFLTTYRNAADDKIEEYRKVFDKSMKACVSVFGDTAFRLKIDLGKEYTQSAGEWATRPNAAIFQVIATSFTNYDLAHITRASDSIYEAYINLILTDDQWVDRVRRATGETSRVKYTFDTWHTLLDEIMQNTEKNDNKRTFSKLLKKAIFDNNPTCSLCGQRIILLDDAVLDHDQRYWTGGKTIPENAQLAHRLCNLKKG